MGSCVSRSGRRTATAKVVDLDGPMAQYAAPVTARDALRDNERASVFLCSSDELRFDKPPRALANEEELQPGWLYFVLPVSMLHLMLSGHEMDAIAVRARSALVVVSGVASRPRCKNVAGANSRQRKTERVAPLVVASGKDAEVAYRGMRKTAFPDGAGKTRKRGGYRSRGTCRRAATPKLSPILEADDF